MVADEGARRMPGTLELGGKSCRPRKTQFRACRGHERAGPLAWLQAWAAHALVLFGLAIVVPVQIYSAFLLHRYSQSERAQNEQRVLQVARALNADIDREIWAIITTLETLATSDALALKDFKSFHLQAKEALRSRPWNVLVIDPSRRQLVNTRLPLGAPLPVSEATDPDLVRIARQTGQPYVTDSSWAPSPSAGSSP